MNDSVKSTTDAAHEVRDGHITREELLRWLKVLVW